RRRAPRARRRRRSRTASRLPRVQPPVIPAESTRPSWRSLPPDPPQRLRPGNEDLEIVVGEVVGLQANRHPALRQQQAHPPVPALDRGRRVPLRGPARAEDRVRGLWRLLECPRVLSDARTHAAAAMAGQNPTPTAKKSLPNS